MFSIAKKILRIPVVILIFLNAQPINANLINEFQPNPSGSDPATTNVELIGAPLSIFTGWIVSIETDSSQDVGIVDRAFAVNGIFNAQGILNFTINDLENPSFTLLLASTFSGIIGQSDIDINNDGIIDQITMFGDIYDAIGIPDNASDKNYGRQLGGQDFTYTGDEPQLTFRDSNTLEWFAINDPDNATAYSINKTSVSFDRFNQSPLSTTFGQINPTSQIMLVSSATVSEPNLRIFLLIALAIVILSNRQKIPSLVT